MAGESGPGIGRPGDGERQGLSRDTSGDKLAGLPVSKAYRKEGNVEMSSWQTPKTNWGQPGQTVPGVDDFNRIEGNIETLGRYDRAPGYGVATGVNTKTVNLDPAPSRYYEGMCFAFRNGFQNTGPVTINVNGLGARSIKKPNGNDLVSGNLKAGSVYTVRYNGTNFILQGSDSAGNATPDDVRAGKTFSNDDGPDQVGTLPDRGDADIQAQLSSDVTIPRGIYDGNGKVLRPIFQAGAVEHKLEPYGVHYIGGLSFYRSSNYRFNYAGQVRLKLYVRDYRGHQPKWLKLYHNTTLIRHIPNPLPGELTEYIDDITVAVNDTVYYEVYNMDSDLSGISSGLSMLLDAEPLVTKI